MNIAYKEAAGAAFLYAMVVVINVLVQLMDYMNYSSEIAPTGQAPAQAPHEIHCEPSITNTPPPSLIAPTGQPPAHEPQPIHESPITNAIIVSSLLSKNNHKAIVNQNLLISK